MRVLDAGSTHTYKMGKNRKHRIRKSKENEAEESSDEGAVICSHIAKAVNFAAMRKALLKPTCTFGECTSCAVEATKSGAKDLFGSPLEGAAASAVEDSEFEPTIWVCLQCGHQGCDRNSREKHALKHFESPHSGIHCIVANLTTWSAWCYTCDNDIPVDVSKRVQECVDFLRKQAGLPRLEFSHFSRPQPTSQSDISPTDPSPPTSQSRADKSQVAGKSSAVACQKVKGLSNLGNTCFFNAVMQNLCQTHSLESLLVTGCKKGRAMSVGGWREPHSDSDSSADGEDEEDGKLKELPMIDIVPGDPGPLTQSLLNFVQEMTNGSAHGTVTPNALFSHVCKKAPRFKGFQQQDSHELLRYLIDVVRNEEIKRAQSGILKHFKLPESVNPKKVDDETKTKIKEYGRQVKFTFLDSLFGGQLVSTITCEECKHISQIFETFLDLSLPVTEEKPQRPNQMQGARRKDSLAAAGGDAAEEAAPTVGVEGFAERCDRPNKYQERKNRRQAKKEAKRKGRLTKSASSAGPGKSVDGEEEGGGEEEDQAMEAPEAKQQGSSNSIDVEEENSSPQEDPSDADVEDNLESETSRLQTVAGNYRSSNLPAKAHGASNDRSSGSNLNHRDRRDSEGEASPSNLPIKTSTVKENHILPFDFSQSGESQPASLDSVGSGIKEEEFREIEKLANGISNLELDNTASERTRGVGPRPAKSESNHADHAGRGEGAPAPAPLINHCDSRAPGHASAVVGEMRQCPEDSAVDPPQREGEAGRDSVVVEGGDGATGLEKDLEEKLTLAADSSVVAGGGGGVGPLPNADKKTSLLNHVAGKTAKEFRRDARYRSKTTLAPRYQPSSKECSVMSCLHQFTAAELLTGSNKVSCKWCSKQRPKNAAPHKDKKGSDAVYSNSSKQFLIMVPPAVLTLHLKRFEQVGYMSRKVNRHVEFPLVLDIAPYCSSLCQDVKCGQRKVLYALYGVVEHSGRLQTGHYTAYVKVRPSLGPLTNFLHSHPPNPQDYIQRYMEQVHNGLSSVDEDVGEEHSAESLLPPGRWFHVSDSRINEVTEATVLKAQAYLLFYERIY